MVDRPNLARKKCSKQKAPYENMNSVSSSGQQRFSIVLPLETAEKPEKRCTARAESHSMAFSARKNAGKATTVVGKMPPEAEKELADAPEGWWIG